MIALALVMHVKLLYEKTLNQLTEKSKIKRAVDIGFGYIIMAFKILSF